MEIIEKIIMGVALLVGAIAVGITFYFMLKGMNIFCWLSYHRVSPSEISYNFLTKEISFHCKVCQKVLYKVKSETQLTDEQYHWFKQIFKNF